MQSWLELEQRFRNLPASLSHSRLDAQWGAAGEHWRVAGTADFAAVQQFEALASLAGQLLERTLRSTSGEPAARLLSIVEPRVRWYNALKDAGQSLGDLGYGEQSAPDGSVGLIYWGSIRQFPEISANLCLTLHASHPVEPKESRWKWFHDNYGKSLIIGAVLALVGAVLKVLFG